jgi:hypothetical protein
MTEEDHVQYATPGTTWTDWLAATAGGDADEAAQLTALREFIEQTARYWVRNGDIAPEWANKKLAKLGVTARILGEKAYVIKAAVLAEAEVSVYAYDRAAALEVFTTRLSGARLVVTGSTVQGDPVFTSGPEDAPDIADPDAPTTVDATLAMLREIILMGHIAGPKYCDYSANQVLAQYGLAPIPDRKPYVVTRPAAATLRTVVDAYDEASAAKVAEWRWDDGRVGFSVAEADPAGGFAVDEN